MNIFVLFKRLNNFYWFFSLDLKSSRKKTQKIISDWINKNHSTKIIKLDELWFNFLSKINKFKPFWMWNLKPMFMIENLLDFKVEFLWKKSRDHLRFSTSHWFKMFAFYMWDFYEEIKIAIRNGKSISIIFDLSEDNWMWKKNLMLKVVDVILE